MRIRKRTPARAASPGPLPPQQQQQQEPLEKPARSQEEEEDKEERAKFLVQEKPQEEDEEKRAVLAAAGVRDGRGDDDRVPAAAAAAASGNSSAADDVPKPEPQDKAAARCSRNDGKRWRCKSPSVPGYLFCDRHIAWSTRKRKPKPIANKHKKSHGSGVLEPTVPKDLVEGHEASRLGHNDGFFANF